MGSVFGRMAQGILSVLGEDALLAGDVPCKINIEHGVQLTGVDGESAAYRGDLVVQRDVATVLLSANPRAGQQFTFDIEGGGPHAGQTWRLESMIEDNGFTRRYIVLKVE